MIWASRHTHGTDDQYVPKFALKISNRQLCRPKPRRVLNIRTDYRYVYISKVKSKDIPVTGHGGP
jgi:hypothetical protein